MTPGTGRANYPISVARVFRNRKGSDGKYDVQLVDADGSHLTPMVSGADDVFSPAPWFKNPPMADVMADGRIIVVLWSTGKEFTSDAKAHVTWMNLDGTSRHQVDTDLNAVYSTASHGKWLGFAGRKMGEADSVQIVDTETSTLYPLFNHVPTSTGTRDWDFSVSPDERQVTVGLSGDGGTSQLYLETLNARTVKRLQLDAKVISVGVWSPDSAHLAYLYSETGQGRKLAVLDLATSQIKLFDQFAGESFYDLKWTGCSSIAIF